MTDQPLSQEMIDALLQQAEGAGPAPAESSEKAAAPQPGDAAPAAEAAAREPSADTPSETAPAPPPEASAEEGAAPSETPSDSSARAAASTLPYDVPGLQITPPEPDAGDAARGGAGSTAGPSVRPAIFSPLPASSTQAGGSSIDLLLDVPLQVTVELGRTQLSVREVLGLGTGSVVELEKLAGEPVDLLVNSRLIARGEVVVIDESFGVRVTEIVRSGGATLHR
ncbi:MAG TPA: flagellar motor switch protein FliN [Armatimonadetes bacterium]|nr:flagellar motor switch protein FliN [Armatimonadota bacterium]